MDRRRKREEFWGVMRDSDVSASLSTRVAVSTEYMGLFNGVAACGGPSGKSPLLSLNARALATAQRKE